MATRISVPYNGKKYTLEFTRKTASIIEKNGFNIQEIDSKPATMLPLLLHGAFLANHNNVKYDTIQKIFSGLGKKDELMQKLAVMYHEAYASLLETDEDSDEGNPGWEAME